MFHYASAIFWGLLQPVNLVGLLLLASVVAGAFRWRITALLASSAGLLVLALAAWTTFGALLLQPLENRFSRPDPLPDDVTGIIVLGGGFEGAINLARGGYELNDSGDRFVEAAILARRFPNARLIISGGNGSVMLAGEGDADTAPRLLEALGVERGRIELEGQSRDTYENAVMTRRLVEPRPGDNWLLVTSAFHMPRSVNLFRKVGFDVIPWPVDYKTAGTENVGLAEDNVIDNLSNTTRGIREWIGLVAYWMTGRTDTILPPVDPIE
ncbi:hypothetical protein GCM10011385_04770 [Nitratireductor aestuarii]|uniref:DUF218 domain-containing protein n=1 Tax=Nitratireductor aestuarii TaxID=1735103 RepID=A0A916VZ69_9HYPH|nr:YdcF family protein [Nitratireductor aestuarii]GGA54236.1 hypothetical protein GCM10011385_04770 [Nitratireductor aestuarii]